MKQTIQYDIKYMSTGVYQLTLSLILDGKIRHRMFDNITHHPGREEAEEWAKKVIVDLNCKIL